MKHKKNKSGGKILLKLFLIILIIFGLWYFENFTIHTSKTTIESSKVSSELNIVQISDLHGHEFGSDNKRLINKISNLSPDLIFVTGDMYTSRDSIGMDVATQLIVRLCDIAPVYFVPGEHDNNEEFMFELKSSGVNVMDYKMKDITVKGNKIEIYGIDNVYYSPTFDLHNEFDSPEPEKLNILLAHIPYYNKLMQFKADITLCGDTHGGVIQIPFLGPMYFEGEWFPEITKGRKNVTDRGLFSDGNEHYMYVSAGLGNYPVPARLFNRPELTFIRIKPKE